MTVDNDTLSPARAAAIARLHARAWLLRALGLAERAELAELIAEDLERADHDR